jgi:hypothetical protein
MLGAANPGVLVLADGTCVSVFVDDPSAKAGAAGSNVIAAAVTVANTFVTQ